MKNWLVKNKLAVVFGAIIILLVFSLAVACFRISAETSANKELTSQNAKLKSGNDEKDKKLEQKDKEIEEKNKQIEEKDKQITDLKKENIELAAKKKAAGGVSSGSAPVSSSYTNEQLQALISSMMLPPPVQQPLKDKVCYLTFDDGPSTNITPRILDTLKKHNVKATFFVVGTANLSLLPRIASEGHAIGLHSYTHQCYVQSSENIYSSPYKYLLDLKAISDAVAAKTGQKPSIIRFPGGGSNLVSKKVCPGIMTTLTKLVQDMGYSYYDWNVSSGDADGRLHSKEEIVSAVVNSGPAQSGKGICVLMHDTNAKTTTADALEGIILGLKNKGYTFEKIAPGTYGFHHSVAN